MSQKPSRNLGGSRPSRSPSSDREGAGSGRRSGAAGSRKEADSRKEAGSRKADGSRKEGGTQGRPQKPQSARSAPRSQKGQGRNPARVQGGSGEKIFARGRSRQPEAGAARSQNKPPRAQAGQPSSKELYPSAEFARREGMLENLPTQMLVNRALKGYAFRKQFPWCLRLVVAYRADPQNGMPVAKEEGALEAFEQNLFGLLKRSVNGHYIGHTSWRGTREFVFYLDEGSEAEEPLNAFAEKQKRELEFALDSDPRWEQVAHYFDYTD